MLPTSIVRKIIREVTQLQGNPPEDIRVQVNEEDVLKFMGIIAGPIGTPYHGGYFKVRFSFGDDFPASPPKCHFATKIFHPNVSAAGDICVNTLKKDWKPTYGITHILTVIKCLLIYPNPESALDEEAGKLLLEDYDQYCSRAKLMTNIHATRGGRPVEFEDEEETTTTEKAADPTDPLTISFLDAPIPVTVTAPSPSPDVSSSTTTAKPVSMKSPSPTIGIMGLPPTSPNLGVTSTLPPLRTSAQSNSARASPALGVDKDGFISLSLGDKKSSREAVSGKAVKRPASAVSGVKENGNEKRKRGLKRL